MPPTDDTGKWKSKLVSSSLPLEFDVAKMLVARGCYVSADYPYLRSEGDINKEFTVDVHALDVISPSHDDRFCTLDILIECKTRNPHVVWLFLPDPNTDFPLEGTGSVLRGIDEFSPWFIRKPTYFAATELAACYKGVEVDTVSGNVFDAELRHGISQLQFALPALLSMRVDIAVDDIPGDNLPFFFVPILVTNAPLIVAHKNFNVGRVTAAKAVEELGQPVPYLSLYVDTGPEFEAHIAFHFSHFVDRTVTDAIREADAARRAIGIAERLLPSKIISDLAEGADRVGYRIPFNNVIVCNVNSLKRLVSRIHRKVRTAVSSLTREPPNESWETV